MAGRGPAPKEAGQRRRYGQPSRGEWVDLQPLAEPILKPFDPETMTCKAWLWEAWRASPIASQYDDTDIAAITVLAETWAELTPADQDRRMCHLGLNPKGKRDLRWRTPAETKTHAKAAAASNVTRLRAVGNNKET